MNSGIHASLNLQARYIGQLFIEENEKERRKIMQIRTSVWSGGKVGMHLQSWLVSEFSTPYTHRGANLQISTVHPSSKMPSFLDGLFLICSMRIENPNVWLYLAYMQGFHFSRILGLPGPGKIPGKITYPGNFPGNFGI